MSSYRWRSYVLSVLSGADHGHLFLTNVAETRSVLGHFSESCQHNGSLRYRVERVWFDNGFEISQPVGESIQFPPLLEADCACRLLAALS